MAQERRAQAGELGSHRVELPDKPYGLRAGRRGDLLRPSSRSLASGRVENGITGTVLDTDRDEDRVTIETHEREPREVDGRHREFSDINLGYAVHVYKAQGITAEASGILTGGWQTDREHAYVAAQPRPRADPGLRLARGSRRAGDGPGAIERLGERIERSRAQEATIAKQTAAERDNYQAQLERDSHRLRPRRRPRNRVADEDGIVRDPREAPNERNENSNARPVPQTDQGQAQGLPDIREADPNDIQINVMDHGETQLAYSNAYDLTGHTGEPTYALFGGWQTEKTLGYVAVVQNGEGHTGVQISTEERGDREIETALKDRIGQVIERSQTQHANPYHQSNPDERTNTPESDPEHEHQADQPAELQPGETAIDPEIQQIIEEQQDRQQDWERSIEPDQDNDRDNDLGFGIE